VLLATGVIHGVFLLIGAVLVTALRLASIRRRK
jgi:hypothetical protein